MDFSYSEKTQQLRAQVRNFMDDHIVPRIGCCCLQSILSI